MKKNFGSIRTDYRINVRVFDNKTLDQFIDEAYGLMGAIRGDLLEPESTFQIRKSDAMASDMNEAVDSVGIGVTVIGYITLFGAAIGLMNIMLVSVTERTREIGLRKAVGAKRSTILTQFLIETMMLSLIGGAIGVGFGWAVSEAVRRFDLLDAQVTMGSVILAFSVVALVGIVFGIYPAFRASRLSPIEALRYE